MAVRRDLVKGAALLAILVAWDLVVPEREWMARWIGPDGFPWRRHWLTETVLHDGARLVALLAMAALMVNVIRPLWPGPDLRDRLLGLLGSAVGLVGVPALKRLSTTSCPWTCRASAARCPGSPTGRSVSGMVDRATASRPVMRRPASPFSPWAGCSVPPDREPRPRRAPRRWPPACSLAPRRSCAALTSPAMSGGQPGCAGRPVRWCSTSVAGKQRARQH